MKENYSRSIGIRAFHVFSVLFLLSMSLGLSPAAGRSAMAADAPVLNPIGDQEATVNQLLTFTATASDVDGDPLTFSLDAGAPAGAAIDPETGTFTWVPTIPGMYSVTVRVSDGALEDFETITITVVVQTYLPSLHRPVPGISGKVTIMGNPAYGIHLYLRFYNGASWSTLAETYTDSNGNYVFSNVPSLSPGQIYYVRFVNESYNDSLLCCWWTANITSYTAGNPVPAGSFDLANIELTDPAPGANVALPTTFSWIKRAATQMDSYEVNLFNPAAQNPYFFTNMLGYVNQYVLAGLPSGFRYNTGYGWFMAVYSPDGGYGESYYYHPIYFHSGASQPDSADLGAISGDINRQPLFRTGMEKPIRP